MNNLNFFYCYSKQLFYFLHKVKGFKYICTGLHEKTRKKFWQFLLTPELDKALKQYSAINNENND